MVAMWHIVTIWAAVTLVVVLVLCFDSKLETVASPAVSIRADTALGGGAPAAPGGADSGGAAAALQPKRPMRSPANVVLLTFPKTASTSIAKAIRVWGRGQTPPFGKTLRIHYPVPELATTVRAKNCTQENRCLIISTVRKPGPQLISLFFHTCNNDSAPRCQDILRSTDEELDGMFFRQARREIRMLAHWWSQAHRLLREAGLNFDLADLRRDRVAVLPEADWLVLRFEIDNYQTILGRWFPGVRVEHTLDHRQCASASQYERMSARLRDESRWPADVWAGMLASETARLFYAGGAGHVNGESDTDTGGMGN